MVKNNVIINNTKNIVPRFKVVVILFLNIIDFESKVTPNFSNFFVKGMLKKIDNRAFDIKNEESIKPIIKNTIFKIIFITTPINHHSKNHQSNY